MIAYFSVNISKVGKYLLNWWWNWIHWTFCVVDLHSGSIICLLMTTLFAYFSFPTVTCKKIHTWNYVAFHIYTWLKARYKITCRCVSVWSWESAILLQVKFRLHLSHILILYVTWKMKWHLNIIIHVCVNIR